MFEGFSEDAFRFYGELDRNNNKVWWLANKARYESVVREPMLTLGEELELEFGAIKMFRPYRDVRFSADKSPYKEHAAIVCENSREGGGLYLQLGASGIRLGGGFYRPAKDQLARFREAMDVEAHAKSWRHLISELAKDGFALMDEDSLTTAPKGWSKDHPNIDLLRLTNLAIDKYLDTAGWMSTSECYERVRDEWLIVEELNAWLAERVGRSELPVRGR